MHELAAKSGVEEKSFERRIKPSLKRTLKSPTPLQNLAKTIGGWAFIRVEWRMLHGFYAQESKLKSRSLMSDAAARSTQDTPDHKACGVFFHSTSISYQEKNTPDASR